MTGDNVCSLELVDFNGSGQNEVCACLMVLDVGTFYCAFFHMKKKEFCKHAHSFMYVFMHTCVHTLAHTHLILFINRLLYFSFQLIVGSEDFDIRVFREDEIIAEMTETEV